MPGSDSYIYQGVKVAEFSGRLTQAPLVYALCQVRFSPVLKMPAFVPDIQERLRTNYDEFAEEQATGIHFIGSGEPVTVKTEPRWRFDTADQRSGFVLQNSSLIYHTTAYTDFEDFVQRVVEGFLTVSQCANVTRLQRVGLRYVDLIEGQEGAPIEDLVHSRLQGFGHELANVTENASQYFFSGTTSSGQLVFRATLSHHQLPLPPDLLPVSLKLSRVANPQGRSMFLDTDHFTERSDPPMPPAGLEVIMRELKLPIAQAFKLAITDRAVALWR
jgi:uncharacterized protein (TIGR04255 family)